MSRAMNIQNNILRESGTINHFINPRRMLFLGIGLGLLVSTAGMVQAAPNRIASITAGTQSGAPVYGDPASTALFEIIVTPDGGTSAGSATLAVSAGLPAGASALFSQNPVTLPAGSVTPITLLLSITTGTAAPGTVTLTVQQGANRAYPVLTINKADQAITVTAAAPASAGYSSVFNVAATASSGLAVAITSSGVCSGSGIDSATITVGTSPGDCTVSYAQAGDANYNAAPMVTSTTAATKASQTITVTAAAPASANYNSTFGVAATASSGLAVAITSSGSCSGGGTASATITMISGTGDCTVTYDQAGDASYNAAPTVTSTTTAIKVPQTITITTPAPATAAYASSFTVAATAGSGLGVAITSSGSCSGSGSGSASITMTSGTGACTLNYDQAGDTNYNPAPTATSSTTGQKLDQTITFGGLFDKAYGDAPFSVSATASSALVVTFDSQTPAACSVSAGTVSILTAGPCTIRASQSGDADYNTAAPTDQSFNVNTVSLSVTADAASKSYGASDPALTYSAVGFVNGDTVAIMSGVLARAAGENVGTYSINQGSVSAGSNYTISYSGAALTVTAAGLTITAAAHTKEYDGTTTATATPGVSGLQFSDTVTGLSEAFVDRTAETGKTLTVTGYTVNDGNSGNNYSVTLANNTTGIITSKPLTVSGITASGKVYNSTTEATLNTGAAVLSGVVDPDDVNLETGDSTGSFADANVGAGKTVTVSGLTTSGLDRDNYSLTQPTTTASITNTKPIFSLTSPAPNSYINTVSAGYKLDKEVFNGTGTITFTRTGGTDDAGSPHVYSLTGSDMTEGSHTATPGLILANGAVYTVSFDVADDQGYAADTVSNANILYDTAAASVTLTAPAASSYVNGATVQYTLNEDMTAGTVLYTWTSGPVDGASPHTYTLSAPELTSGSHTVNTGFGLVDGAVYTVSIENAVDLAGNASAAVTNSSVTYDATSIAITSTAPAAGSAIVTAHVGYALSEQSASGRITFTRTGGAPDTASPRVYALSGADLTAGPHFVDTGLLLADGTIYTVSFDAADLAGNNATTVSNGSVIFDQSAPLGAIILNNGIPVIGQSTVGVVVQALDDGGITGYFLSESSTQPSVDDPLWIAVTTTTSFAAEGTIVLSAGDGSKGVYAWFRDRVGHVSTAANASVTVDSSGTAFSTTNVSGMVVSTLPDGSSTSDPTLNISGIVSLADGIQAVLVGSDPVFINPDGSYSIAVALSPGANVVEITIIDADGNQSTVSRTIICDPAAPALSVAGPADGLQTARNTVDISGSTDPNALVTITVNQDSPITADRSGAGYSSTVNLEPGINTILITTQLNGTTQTVKRTVFYDFRKPGLAVTAPDKDMTVINGAITFAGTVTDALTEVTVTVTANGTDYHPSVDQNGAFTQAVTFSEEGIYPVVVTATDLNGNSSIVRRNVRFQRGYLIINRGAGTATSTLVTLDLSYVPAAPATKASTMQLLFNNTSWTAATAFTAKKTVTLPAVDGVKTVSVRYTDDTGNVSAFYSDTIILDTKVPLGSITINEGAAVTTVPGVTLNLAVADANGVVKMQFSDNGTTWSALQPFAVKTAWSLPGTFGTKKVFARFVDSAGKVSAAVSDTIMYAASTAGSTAGQVTVKSGDSYTTTPTVPVALVIPEGKTQMRVSVNGTTWAAWETAKTSKSVVLPAGDGVKTVYVQFRASAAETPAESFSDSIVLDTIVPKGAIQINGGLYSTTTPTVTLTLTASDLNGVKEMQLSVTNIDWATRTWEPFNGTKTVTLAAGQGNRSVWVKYKDNAGKISAAVSDAILVDALAPTGKVLINAGATVITSRNVTLSFIAAGATYLKLSLNDGATWGAWEPFVASKKATLTAGDGTKTVRVKFRDVTGNESGEFSASASYAQAAAPDLLTVPDLDSDGTYSVLWSASPTTAVTYVLQEATNSAFTSGLRTAYSGAAAGVNITLRPKGKTYYYRVQAKKTGLETSAWTTGANGCNVGPAGTPASITVPAADADGTYAVAWGASITPGATYVLEEATDAAFTKDLRTAYSGAERTASISGNSGGMIYYYRVKAQASGFPDSAWKNGLNACKAGSLALPSGLTVPATDVDGTYGVAWTPSATPGVSYEVQEAANAAFTMGLRTINAGTEVTATISGRTLNKTYYYRVRTIKTGFTATTWVTAGNGCAVANAE